MRNTDGAALTDLEAAILAAIATSRPELGPLVADVRVTSRELTGCGSYTQLHSSAGRVFGLDRHIGLDALTLVPGVNNGLGAVLFCKQGKPEFLEIYTYGEDGWDGNSQGFVIESA
jgi:hypothetical protein